MIFSQNFLNCILPQLFGKDFQLFTKLEELLGNFGYICEKKKEES